MEKLYTITLYDSAKGEEVSIQVTKPIFDEYRRGIWRIHKNNKKHAKQSTVFSTLKVGDDGTFDNYHEFIVDESDPINVVIDKFDKTKLRNAILRLNDNEKELINSLYFESVSASEYARRIGKSPQYVCQSRNCILKKIKSFLEKSV